MSTDIKEVKQNLEVKKNLELKHSLELKKKKETIHIFLMGQDHTDPDLFSVLEHKVKEIAKKNIPMVFCMESEHDKSLAVYIHEYERMLYHYDRLQAGEVTATPEMVFKLIRDMPVYKKGLSLFKLLESQKIPVYGIDYDASKIIEYYNMDMTQKAKQESHRMNTMADNTIKALGCLEEKGGILFVIKLGCLHSHRLAVFLSQKLENHALLEKHHIQITATRTFSDKVNFGKMNRSMFYDALHKMNQFDQEEVRKKYLEIPCYDLAFSKLKNKSLVSEEFESLQANALNKFEKAFSKEYVIVKFSGSSKNAEQYKQLLGPEIMDTYVGKEVSISLTWLRTIRKKPLKICELSINLEIDPLILFKHQ